MITATRLLAGARFAGRALRWALVPSVLSSGGLRQQSIIFAAAGAVGDLAVLPRAQRGEDFSATIARLGISDASIDERLGAYMVTSRAAYSAAAICAASAAWLVASDLPVESMSLLAASLGCLAAGWWTAYRAAQLHARRWASLAEFAAQPRAWFW